MTNEIVSPNILKLPNLAESRCNYSYSTSKQFNSSYTILVDSMRMLGSKLKYVPLAIEDEIFSSTLSDSPKLRVLVCDQNNDSEFLASQYGALSMVFLTSSGENLLERKNEILASTAPSWQKNFFSSDASSNSTRYGIDQRLLERRLKALFAAGRDEIFEDGMESEFSNNLLSLLDQNQDSELAFDIIGDLVLREQVSTEVASEALQWIGRIENYQTEGIRRTLLENCVTYAKSSRVKDGAIVGLSFLNNPKSIKILQEAIAKESIPQLRENMEQVLEQLIETRAMAKGE